MTRIESDNDVSFFASQRPGPYGAITDIIKGLFTDMKHYVQGLELFQEAKVHYFIVSFFDYSIFLFQLFQLNQILSWNRNLFRYDFYDMDLDHEHIKRRETYFYRVFLFTHGPVDVSSALYKFEVSFVSHLACVKSEWLCFSF